MESQGLTEENRNLLLTLEEEDENVLLVWVLAEDTNWYLCCLCDGCSTLMKYPGVMHRCPANPDVVAEISTVSAVSMIPTTIEEAIRGLHCEESS